ncbi:MAG: hypothetical protein K0R67_200 [Paenibacillus sp.]|nr:hypothetical protein [Paenibacillus sp.]
MNFGFYLQLSLMFPIVLLLVIIVYKMIKGKALPDMSYTPLDNIIGQSSVVFHEEKETKEEDNDQDEGKTKRKKNGYYF